VDDGVTEVAGDMPQGEEKIWVLTDRDNKHGAYQHRSALSIVNVHVTSFPCCGIITPLTNVREQVLNDEGKSTNYP